MSKLKIIIRIIILTIIICLGLTTIVDSNAPQPQKYNDTIVKSNYSIEQYLLENDFDINNDRELSVDELEKIECLSIIDNRNN